MAVVPACSRVAPRHRARREAAGESSCPSLPGVFWSLVLALGWGAIQSVAVELVTRDVGWASLPHHTIEDACVRFFLALSGCAWLALSFALLRRPRPLQWFWWGACATWWVMLFIPYQRTHSAFRQQLARSERSGAVLAGRIQRYRGRRGRLPGQLRDVTDQDGQPIPATEFGTGFDYRQSGLTTFELALPVGDRTYVFASNRPGRGFQLRYFGP